MFEFFDTIPQMIVLSYALRYVDPRMEDAIHGEVFKLADKQWKVLKELGDRRLDIYRDTEDKKSVAAFVDLIKKEKELREKNSKEGLSASADLKQIIGQRIELYKIALDYTPKDKKEACQLGMEKAKEFIEKKRGKGKIILRLGILGAAAGAVAGIGYLYHKKNKKREKVS